MNRFTRPGALGALVLVLGVPFSAAKPLSDLISSEKRRVAVELSRQLTRQPEPVTVPTDLANPFNPPNFEQPDPEELKAAAASRAAGAAAGGGQTQVARPPGEREVLESLAMQLPTTGSIVFLGEPILLAGARRLKVGDKFVVATKAGQDYELELIAIDRTTFTLRYHGEEITRSIKLGKSP